MAMRLYIGGDIPGLTEYDDEMFHISYDPDTGDYLHFKDSYVGPISLPKNIETIKGMFNRCDIKPGCYFKDFNTVDITDMRFAFYMAKIPEGFDFGSNFDMSNAEKTKRMFYEADIPDDFNPGLKFKLDKLDDDDRVMIEKIFDKQKAKTPVYDKLKRETNKIDDNNFSNSVRIPGEQ